MPDSSTPTGHVHETEGHAFNGWPMLAINILLVLGGIATVVDGARWSAAAGQFSLQIPLGFLISFVGGLSLNGHFTLQPNEARVLILFGKYHGTARKGGFFWGNPFFTRTRGRIPILGADPVASKTGHGDATYPYRILPAKISLRARNFI